MAEQEACADLVEKASQEQQTTEQIEGESLLLPLLQGLLQTPETDQTPDSGTESGEDHQRNGLIIEVQNALDKLSNSLRNNTSTTTDITAERRSNLLQLVTKLQAGLSTTLTPLTSTTITTQQQTQNLFERRNSSGVNNINVGRFNNRRRQRQNRHTVGVSREELADARRLMEEISLQRDLISSSSSSSALMPSNNLEKQQENTESSVQTTIKSNPDKAVVRNAVAKPFSCSNSTSTSSIQTPTDPSEFLEFLFNDELKVDKQIINENQNDVVKESDTDDESTTVQANEHTTTLLKSNPIYTKPIEEKSNRFSTKKMKIKRANTIDIPKPLNFYEDDDDDDSDISLPEDDLQRRRNTYYALRGPIRVGQQQQNNTKVPSFEPKTESDKKFMAFINKHNSNNDVNEQKNTLWTTTPNKINVKTPVWGNKFGTIRNTFESPLNNNNNNNSARQFWKTTEDTTTNTRVNNGNKFGPKISKQSARNLQQMFEDKQKQIKEQQQTKHLPWSEQTTKFIPINKFTHAPQSAFKPIQPRKILGVQQNQSNNNDYNRQTLFLYSPKPLNEESPNTTTMVTSKPWAATAASEHNRVLSLAAQKFENNNRSSSQPVQPPSVIKKEKTKPVEFSSQTSVKYVSSPSTIKSNQPNSYYNNKTPPRQYYQHVPGQEIIEENNNNNNYSQELNITLKPHKKIINHSYSPLDYQFNNHQIIKHRDNNNKVDKTTSINDKKIHSYNPLDYQFSPKNVDKQKPQPNHNNNNNKEIENVSNNIDKIKDGEYTPVSSKVMSSPISQMATTVRQKSPMTRDEHDIEAAFNLRNTLQKVSTKSGSTSPAQRSHTFTYNNNKNTAVSPKQETPPPPSRNFGIVKPIMQQQQQQRPIQSLQVNDRGESIVTSHFKIPVINVPKEPIRNHQEQKMNILSKSDSWHQICLQQQQQQQQLQHKPSPRSSPLARSIIKSKSSHSLAVTPKQFEAGMTKEELLKKKSTMEAYFTPTKIEHKPNNNNNNHIKRSINRIKTSEKTSAVTNHNVGLARSRTLPEFCPELLDENNVDQAFEDLFKSST